MFVVLEGFFADSAVVLPSGPLGFFAVILSTVQVSCSVLKVSMFSKFQHAQFSFIVLACWSAMHFFVMQLRVCTLVL